MSFHKAVFSGQAVFDSVKFKCWSALFGNATFAGSTDFSRAVFDDWAGFDNVTFASKSWFVNTEMNGPVSFKGATFASDPPRFFGATLHQGTVWDAKWPATPTDRKTAGEFVYAYQPLKLEMDRLKKHEDEMQFFIREMKCRRVRDGFWSGIPIGIFGCLCNYGWSYLRPVFWLFITIVVGALLFLPHFWTSKWEHAIGMSFANTFGIFGFRKDFLPDAAEHLPQLLTVVACVQTIFGATFLFLLGLALRNRFRIR